MKKFLKYVGLVTAQVTTYTLVFSSSAMASDLDIYKSSQSGKVTVTLMLDTSGSMNFVDNSNCQSNTTQTSNLGSKSYTYEKDGKKFTTSIQLTGCASDSTNNRITNLKDGILGLLSDPEKLQGDISIGLGYYSTEQMGRTGNIVIPAKKVDFEHRRDLANKIASLQTGSGTPTAHAYAEVGAYMLGTSTSNSNVTESRIIERGRVLFNQNNNRWELYKCYIRRSTTRSYTSGDWYDCYNSRTYSLVDRKTSRGSLDLTRIGITNTTDTVVANGFYGERLTKTWSTNPDSGMGFSSPDTKTSNQQSYLSPIANKVRECDGNGIYFLTDGVPNSSSDPRAKTLMDTALNGTSTVSCSSSLINTRYIVAYDSNGQPVYQYPTGWRCIGDFAKQLRDTSNPKGAEIKTAVVGYGSAFAVARDKITVDGKSYANCNTIPNTSPDAKNACNWGAKTYDGDDATIKSQLAGVGGYGEGGFYYADDADAVASSIEDFAKSLEGELKPLASGTISSPADSLDPSSFSLIAYLPIIEPKPGKSDIIWPGNLKKYRLKQGALIGKNNAPLFIGDEKDLNPDTMDLWNSTNNTDLAVAQTGGVFDRVLNATDSIKDRKIVTNNNSALKKLSVNENVPVGFDAIGKSKINNEQRRQLLNYMGYPIEVNQKDVPNPLVDENKNEIVFKPSSKVMGGVVHSKPQIVSYSADYNEKDDVFEKRKDFILFGSMEGALHVINKETGNEELTFVPKEVLQKQGSALVKGSTSSNNKPVHGVDAPWTVYSKYEFKANGKKIFAKKLYAYGGLRMGGDSMYGLNLKNISNPKLLFHISRSKTTYKADGSVNLELKSGFKNDQSEPGYSRLGQTWSKPAITRVWHKGERILVAVIGGGYDTRYENPYFDPKDETDPLKKKALGNAIYIVAAEKNTKAGVNAGDIVGWVSSDATQYGLDRVKVDNMIHSIVAEPRILDRNNDGLVDHIYVGDLGGQVFRVDIQNRVGDDSATFKVKRAVQVLNATVDSGEVTNSKADKAPRFYERPTVTFHRMGGLIQAMVTIGSGDRSSPKHERTQANRLYVFKDADIARKKLFEDGYNLTTKNVEPKSGSITSVNKNQLADLSYSSNREKMKEYLINNKIGGWYIPYDFFDGKSDVKGLKVLNKPVALANNLYATVYSPTSKKTPSDCEVGVVGETEIRQYCLPYGACYERDSQGKLKLVSTANTTGKSNHIPDESTNKLCQGICDISQGGNDSCVTDDCQNNSNADFVKQKSKILGEKCDGLYTDTETRDNGVKCEETSNTIQAVEWFERRTR